MYGTKELAVLSLQDDLAPEIMASRVRSFVYKYLPS
jgi:hypothetical protein